VRQAPTTASDTPQACYRDEVVSSPLNVHLEHYEGPLDLLLDLIRRQQIDIWDIPIAQITAQYLDYVQKAAELDIELSAEFVLMAATLIHIKSRMLLPKDPELERISADEDPRRELVEKLLEHERFRNAAEMLQQKRLVEENIWSNPQLRAFLAEEDGPGLEVTLFDLVATFQAVLERAKNRPAFQVNHENVTVAEMIGYVTSLLRNRPKGEPLSVLEILEQQHSLGAMVCLFLAILELVKIHAIVLAQKTAFGDILIKRHKQFEEALATAAPDVEKDYN